MDTNFFILIFILATFQLRAQGTIVSSCGGSSTLSEVDIEGCVDAVNDYCRFTKGQQYKIGVRAVSGGYATNMTYTGRVVMPMVTIFKESSCENLTSGDCPAEIGELFETEYYIDIFFTLPAFQATLKVEVQDEANNLLLCSNIKFEIANP